MKDLRAPKGSSDTRHPIHSADQENSLAPEDLILYPDGLGGWKTSRQDRLTRGARYTKTSLGTCEYKLLKRIVAACEKPSGYRDGLDGALDDARQLIKDREGL